MPQDVGEQQENALAVWIWDLGLRRIRAANAPALALWGASSEVELFTQVFGPSDPMTRAGVEARARLDGGEAQVRLVADVAGLTGLTLHCDQPTRAPHLLRFAHQINGGAGRQPPPLPDSVFDAAPFAMSVIDANGAVERENAAAKALYGPQPAAEWRQRHAEQTVVEAAMAHASAHGGAGYVAQLRVLGGRRRLSINLTAIGDASDGAPSLLASASPIPDADDALLSGNAAEEVLHAAPSAVAVFSLETEELLYANAAASALGAVFREPEAALRSVFPNDAAALRRARSEILLDVRQTPRALSLPRPDQGDGRLFAQATIGFWRGASAFFLWMWPQARPTSEAPAPVEPVADKTVGAVPPPAAAVNHAQRIQRAALIAEASHAMRTNVTSIRGFAELLIEQKHDTPQAGERLRDIVAASDQLAATLEAFLTQLMRLED